MTGLCVIGAGGHGKVVADCADSTGRWRDIVFVDDGVPAQTTVGRWRVASSTNSVAALIQSHSDLVVALGDNRLRVACLLECQKLGFNLVSIVHPQAFVSEAACLGEGTVVLAQAAVNFDAVVGIGNIINTGATVDHDCRLGDGVHVSPGAHLAGSVHIGDYSWIGIGATINQTIRIGTHSIVGAGAAVIGDVASDCTVVGVPAHAIKTG